MSRSQTTQTGDRNSSSNTKLYSSSLVVNLTRSWQTWVTESDGKQASGRASACQGEPAEEPKNTWSFRKETSVLTPYPHPGDQATAVSQNLLQADPRGNRKTSPLTQKLSQDGSTRTEGGVEGETSAVPVVESHSNIKTKQVVKTVSTGAQEKGAGIGFLRVPERITEEPSREEIDKMLNQQSSPTRRTKCSNAVSPLTKSWKQVEKELKPVEDDEHVDAVAGQNDRTGSCIETEHNGSPEEDSKSSSVSWVKRPSLPIHRNKDAEDASKINALSKKYSAVGNLKSRWQNWSSEHTVNQKQNPFSEEFDHEYSMSTRLHKGQEGYGRPKEGTMTAERAKRAEQHIHREIADMCYVIRTMKDPDKDGKTRVTFKELFDQYVRISDKVVGILIRARKHGKVAFEGEMLWQGQDDAVIITLLV